MAIIEENRLKNATYLDGTGHGKRFKSVDNTLKSQACSGVPKSRVYHVDNPLEEWTYSFTDPDHQTLFESMLTAFDLLFDSGFGGCHWTAEGNNSGGGISSTITWDLVVTPDGSLVDYELTVRIEITGLFSDSHEVVYTKADVDPDTTGPWTFTTTANEAARTWTFPNADFLIWPEEFVVETDPNMNVEVERTLIISLTDTAGDPYSGTGDAYLTFAYVRQSDPNIEGYYIEPSDPFRVQIGPGTDFETVGDITGHAFAFTHDGDGNLTPANGTEDADISITIEHVSISNALP